MDISIIIGLLIALAIISVTTIVNNIISHNYNWLKKRWNDRTEVITDIVLCVGNLDKLINDFADEGKATDDDKRHIFSILVNIKRLLDDVKDYEKNNY